MKSYVYICAMFGIFYKELSSKYKYSVIYNTIQTAKYKYKSTNGEFPAISGNLEYCSGLLS